MILFAQINTKQKGKRTKLQTRVSALIYHLVLIALPKIIERSRNAGARQEPQVHYTSTFSPTFPTLILIDLEVGVWLRSATLLTGTSGFASGK